MKKEDIKKTDEENIVNEEGKTYKIKSNKSKKKIIIASICLSIVVLLAFIFSTIFALINLNNVNIISGIKVNGIEISNLSKEEAIKKLQEKANQKLESDIVVKTEDFEYGIKLSQIETNYNIEKALEQAYNTGRSGNIFTNNYDIIKTLICGKEIELEYTYNEELLNKLLNDMNSKVPNSVVEANYCIENNKLIITEGKKGTSIDIDEVKQLVLNEILSNNKEIQINAKLIEKEPLPIDIDKIYEEVHTEPKNAYYTKNPFQVFPHIDGVDFDLEEARQLLKEEKEEYEIKLTITKPEVTTNEIGTEAFPDLLSSFSTRYDASNYPRTTNLKLAMGKLNGVVVGAGETFSYNKTLGKRTAEAGYREAGGYAGGRVVQTLAGGICQISSTLYDAVIYANLDIVERHNHMFLAGYVGAGKDATVVYGSLDFKFKNTRKFPIMIKTSIGNGVAKIDIYGIKEEVEYDVDIVTSVLSYTPFRVIYEDDPTLKPGQEKVSQSGMNGCKSITYKVVKLNGVEVSREVLSSDTYDPMNKIIKRGPEQTVDTNSNVNTETETPNTTPTPTPDSEPNPNPDDGTSSKPEQTQKPTPTPDSAPSQKPETTPDPTPSQKPESKPDPEPTTTPTPDPEPNPNPDDEASSEENESTEQEGNKNQPSGETDNTGSEEQTGNSEETPGESNE